MTASATLAAGFLSTYGQAIAERTAQHLQLSMLAIVLATAGAVPVGILLARSRSRWLTSIVLGIVNILQPVPSLALVALISALYLAVNQAVGRPVLPTLGLAPGLVPLVAYAVLPILRNTYTGIRQVDPAIVEVARGMGMTGRQVLLQVQLPLAVPVIMAGIRTSTVWSVGVATLVSTVGAGGLGDLIFRGLAGMKIDLILAGAVPAVLLALIFDGLLACLERWLTPDRGHKQ